MRIAFIVSRFPCPSETFIVTQLRQLADRGHEVHVYAEPDPAHEGALPATEYAVHRPLHLSGGRLRRLFTLFVAFLRLKHGDRRKCLRAFRYGHSAALMTLRYAAATDRRRETFDVIHAHFGPNGVIGAAMRAAGLIAGRLVVSFHGFDVSSHLRAAGRDTYDRLFEEIDLSLPVTEHWRNRLLELGSPSDRTVVLPMGVDCASIPARVHTASDTAHVVTVARLVEKKGVETAIRAIARVGRSRRYRYTIVGDGPDRGRLKSLIEELGIGDSVRMSGWVEPSAVHRLLAGADLFVLPSATARNGDEEGLPVAIMEAMAAGLPVVSTRHSGIPELVRDGTDGFLVAEHDVEALAARIAELIDDVTLRSRMGESARIRVMQRHDSEMLGDRLVELYRAVTGGSAKHQPATPIEDRSTALRPVVSIIMPTRNRASVLRRAVVSVSKQTFDNWELIVVDDASTDNTPAVMAELTTSDARITYIRSDVPAGAAAARNTAIRRARGEFLAFLDDDDEWHENALLARLDALRDGGPEAGAVHCGFVEVTPDGRERARGEYHVGRGQATSALCRDNFIGMSTVIARRSIVEDVGAFDEALPRLQDWDLWIRMSRVCSFGYVPAALVRVHSTPGSISSDPAALLEASRLLVAKYDGTGVIPIHAFCELLFALGRLLERNGLRSQGRALSRRALEMAPASRYVAMRFASVLGHWPGRIAATLSARFRYWLRPAGPSVASTRGRAS